MIDSTDLQYLRRCVELAEEALVAGDEPFGSLLVTADGRLLAEERNHVSSGDATQHPEFALACWASAHLTVAERAGATVYTSGEHCPMCAAAHGWVGLGRIVYATSGKQLGAWLADWGVTAAPVAMLPIETLVPGIVVDGPADELVTSVRELHRRLYNPA